MPFYKIPAQDICMGDPAPFGQRWEARVPLPLTEVGDIGTALHSRYSEFRPGDLVNICCFDSLRWNHMTEVAAFRITSTDHDKLAVVMIGKPVAVPKPEPTVTNAPDTTLRVVKRNNAFEVRDERGNVIDVFVERAQADRFIADNGAKAAA